MQYEVEQKFRARDLSAIAEQLKELGAERGATVQQVDEYFAHPSRDFAQTDEALRLRRVGETAVITYKGPKVDAETKTRREIELPLAGGGPNYRAWGELLDALGFRSVLEVVKSRTPYRMVADGHPVEVALDELAGLGGFVEIETAADEEELDAARERMASIASNLNLMESERRSYLELLLEEHSGR